MPVVRLPVVHKFGIVSVSRAEQLLREGRKDRGDSSSHSRTIKASAPTKISQAFIAKYNRTPETERGKLDRIVRRTFSQAKYKAGLHQCHGGGGAVSPSATSLSPPPAAAAAVRLPAFSEKAEVEGRVCDAWLEFILLCQCYGPHQEEVLLALATSLNHAPLSTVHIPSLLYMSGLCYQWLKCDLSVGHTDQLRTGELMLLRILYLISLRLFYHHMIGTLQDTCTREDIRQLKFDLAGFESREKVYRNFPEALLHWKVALEVGQVVVEKNSPAILHDPSDPNTIFSSEHSPEMRSSGGGTEGEGRVGSGGGGHRVSAILWHSLDVWRVVRGIAQGQQEDAIADLLACSTEFNISNWMESLLAINILCLGSQFSLAILSLVSSLANGTSSLASHPSPHHTSAPHNHQHTSLSSGPHSPSLFRDTPTLSSDAGTETGRVSEEKNPPSGLSPKKGTRFKLPASEADTVSYSHNHTGSDAVTSDKHRSRVDTLNVLGVQPNFREHYPESVYTEIQSPDNESAADDDYHTHLRVDIANTEHFQMKAGMSKAAAALSRHTADLESVATQSLVESELVPRTVDSSRASSHSQHLSGMGGIGSESTLGVLSPSHSLVITSSPWLKSSTSKNLEWSNDDQREGGSVGVIHHPPLGESDEFHENKADKESMVGGSQGTGVVCETERKAGSTAAESLEKVRLLAIQDHIRVLPVRQPSVSGRSVTLSQFGRNVETRCTHYTHSSSALTGGAGVPGSHIAPSTVYRHSVYSPLTIDVETEESGAALNSAATETHCGFESWPSEVALAYTLNMCDVVLYGRTSHIQSMALDGVQGAAGDGKGVGLRYLANFSLNPHPQSRKSDFMAWTIRHVAVLGLSRVCRTCKRRTAKEGLSSVAWSELMQGHTTEKDSRVLEAYKLSQVYPDVDEPLLAVDPDTLSSPLLVSMADELAKAFLPPAANTTSFSTSKSPPKRWKPTLVKNSPTQKASAKVDTHHRQSGVRKEDFATRTLTGIMEQDWKREMQKERERNELV